MTRSLTAKRIRHVELASQERARLEVKWKKDRENVAKARKQEKVAAWRRMQADKDKREARWTQKTEAHPFHVDLWAEDEDIYAHHRVNDTRFRTREKAAAKAVLKDSADRRVAKVAEVDQLDILRKEKKKLQEDQKELKARLDLDKVDNRCAAAKYKADMKWDAHQERLADMGHLDRSHSDFFTDPRLNSSQIDEKRQKQVLMQRTSSMSLGESSRSSRQGFRASGSFENARSLLFNELNPPRSRAAELQQ